MTRRFVVFVIFAVLASLVGLVGTAHAGNKRIFIMTWRGCEEACLGFQKYLADKKIEAEVRVRDAGRDKSKIPGFLEEARSNKADLIVTWGTSVTLGTAGSVDDIDDPRFNNDIPQVFMVVADPVGARVVKSLENTGRKNVTGTFNRVPETVNINTIRSYMPTFKTLGLLYNRNEKNSVLKHKEISELAKKMNFDLVALEFPLDENGKPRKEDIPIKVAELKNSGVDFIYLGSSSFLDANRGLFTGSAVENGIPVLSPYERLVRDSHALLSISARYEEVGKLAGRQAEKILVDGKAPGDIPVLRMTKFAYVVNMDVAKQLNLFPPVAVLQIAETVK